MIAGIHWLKKAQPHTDGLCLPFLARERESVTRGTRITHEIQMRFRREKQDRATALTLLSRESCGRERERERLSGDASQGVGASFFSFTGEKRFPLSCSMIPRSISLSIKCSFLLQSNPCPCLLSSSSLSSLLLVLSSSLASRSFLFPEQDMNLAT